MSRACGFRRALAVALPALMVVLGCERKAPNQEECLDFALHMLRITDARLLSVPIVRDQLDELVVKCLTTPFDKQLLACPERRVSPRSCLIEFEDRDRARHSSPSR